MKKFVFVLVLAILALPQFAEGSFLFLKHGKIDTTQQAGGPSQIAAPQTGPAAASPNAKELFLLQFSQKVDDQLKQDLTRKGLTVVEYIPDNGLVVWGTVGSVNRFSHARLAFRDSFKPSYRMDPSLLAAPPQSAAGGLTPQAATEKFRLFLYPFVDVNEVRGILESMGITIESQTSSRWQSAFIISASPSQAADIVAAIPGTKWLEKYVLPVSFNKDLPMAALKDSAAVPAATTDAVVILNLTAGDIMNAAPVWSSGYTGLGLLSAVADTGLDVGSTTTIHPDFSGKVDFAYALGRVGDWSDPNGHGTHVAGSVLGSGVQSSGQFKGIAYDAHLVFQSVMDANGALSGLPSDLNTLFLTPYNDGARVHSNSWGLPISSGGYVYNSNSQQVDQFVWDHKDMVITFSAGNDGTDANSDGVVDLNSVTSPATSKNSICVGATENDNNASTATYGGSWPADFPAAPVSTDNVCDNRNGLAAFSSRGPAPDGRLKPDVVAPGTMIVSTRSQDPNAGTGWGVYDAWYIYMGGTSMSNPLTAGGANLIRDFYINHEGVSPSAALVKATMVNGTSDIFPGQYGTGSTQEIPTLRPNNVEGWGRVDLGAALLPTAPVQLKYFDETAGLTTGQFKEYLFDVTDSAYALKISVVWSDYPSSLTASKNLVNDLDLKVIGPDSTIYYPNHGTAEDRTNNTETIDIATPGLGIYTIQVTAYNVPQGPQPFALAALGAFQTVVDTTPPVISALASAPTATSCDITWTTDEAATSVVEYGLTTALGSTTSVAGYTLAHSVTLSGLSAETLYYYRVRSADGSANESVSATGSFTTLAAPAFDFFDDMESGSTQWTTTPAGAQPWSIVATSYASSGANAWFSADEASIKDDKLQTVSIDLTQALSATLEFYHTYQLETGYDGGVLEISTDGGATFADLGANITVGGYTGTISTLYSSPIGGRSAWTGGTLGAMSRVEVNLDSFVGNNVIIRFRLGCDSSVSASGWYVDDVKVTSTKSSVILPIIDSYSATPLTIEAGGSATLSWATTNAVTCTINGQSVAVDGTMVVTPAATTSYTLVATSVDAATVTQSLTVTVLHTFLSTDTPISIPDNNATGITSTLNVADSATVTSFDVTVNITHTYIGDLIVTLYAPDNTPFVLHDRAGGTTNNLNQTWTITPASPLSINGNWRLTVSDNAAIDLGTLDNWQLVFEY